MSAPAFVLTVPQPTALSLVQESGGAVQCQPSSDAGLVPGQFGLTTPQFVAPDNVVATDATFLVAMPLVPARSGLYQVNVAVSASQALADSLGGNLFLLTGPVVVSGGSNVGTVGGVIYHKTATPIAISGETTLNQIMLTKVPTTTSPAFTTTTLSALVQAPPGATSAIVFFFTGTVLANTISAMSLSFSAVEVQ